MCKTSCCWSSTLSSSSAGKLLRQPRASGLPTVDTVGFDLQGVFKLETLLLEQNRIYSAQVRCRHCESSLI